MPLSNPYLNKQAAFLREQITQWLENQGCRPGSRIIKPVNRIIKQLSGHSKPSPHQKHVDKLLQAINMFLQQNGQEPITVKSQHIDAKLLGEQFVHFLGTINFYENPFNEVRDLLSVQEKRDYHKKLGNLFDAIDDYLRAVDVSFMRLGEVFEISQSDQNKGLILWKKTPSTKKEESVVAVDAVDFNKNVLICCGGVTSMNGFRPHGFPRLIEGKVGGSKIHGQGAEVYSVFYPTTHRAGFFADTHRFNQHPSEHCSEMAWDFLNQFILPGLENIQHPNINQLKERLSHINFFAYSYGTVFVHEVRNGLRKALQEKGYKPTEIKEAFAAIHMLSLGPTCDLGDDKSDSFSTLYVLSPHDLTVRSKSDNGKLLDDMVDTDNKIKSIGDNQLLICSDAPAQAKVIEQHPNGHDTGREGKIVENHYKHHLMAYALSTLDLETMMAHMPRYLRYYLTSILGVDLDKAIDPQMTPPNLPKDIAKFADPKGKIGSYQLAILAEMSKKENIQRQ